MKVSGDASLLTYVPIRGNVYTRPDQTAAGAMTPFHIGLCGSEQI